MGERRRPAHDMPSLFDLQFVNRFTRDLPADPEGSTRPREVRVRA